MAGNVWEWTFDIQAPYAIAALVNPTIETGPDMKRRVIRGGAWGNYVASRMRVAVRNTRVVSERDSLVGFRCARGSK